MASSSTALYHDPEAPNHLRSSPESSSLKAGLFLAAAALSLLGVIAGRFYLPDIDSSEQGRGREGALWNPAPPPTSRVWSAEEEELRQYRWRGAEPHESLKVLIAALNEDDRRTYEWLASTRPKSRAGTGVGLGAKDPPEVVVLGGGGSLGAARGAPGSDEGPGKFLSEAGYDHSKYSDLVKEWQSGRQAEVCPVDSMSWMQDYSVMHQEMMTGKQAPSLLGSYCNVNCGGLADRLFGVTTSFIFSLLTGRAFSILWEHPVPFDLVFDSASIDWAQKYPTPLHETESNERDLSTSARHLIYDNATLVQNRRDVSYVNAHRAKLEGLLSQKSAVWWNKSIEWIRLTINRGTLIHLLSRPLHAPVLQSYGFNEANIYNCIINYLIRPKPDVLKFISAYTAYFTLPSVYAIGVQVRSGDDSMSDAEQDKLNTFEHFQYYFECALAAGRARAKPGQKIVLYLITDSNTLKKATLANLPGQVVVSGLRSAHTNVKEVDDWVKTLDETMDTVAESWIAAWGLDFTILTKNSGFGKIPTWIRGKPGNTIVLPRGLKAGKFGYNCSSEDIVQGFSQIAESWSWGR